MLRAVDRDTVKSLFFTSLSRCNQRLMFLSHSGFLKQHKLACSSQAIYTCGKLGVSIATSACADDGNALSAEDIRLQCRRPSLSLLEHALDIGRLYVAFIRHNSDQGQVTFERFLPERLVRDEWDIRRTDQHPHGSSRYWREVFAPDGAIRLRLIGSSNPLWLFVEVDLGCSKGQLLDKLRTHGRYISQGMAEETYGTGCFKTAIITTSDRRACSLFRIACEHNADFVIVTTLDLVRRIGPNAPIWHVPGRGVPCGLGDLLEAVE